MCYFKPQEVTPNKFVHLIPEFLRQIEPTIEIKFDLKQLRVTAYLGLDFDFSSPVKEPLSAS
jgi:hypothetical protein